MNKQWEMQFDRQLNRRWLQAQDIIQAVLTTRVVLLVLATLILWGSGGYIRDSACKSSAADGADAAAGAWAFSSSSGSSGGGGSGLLGHGAAISDVPGAGPPYILPRFIHQTVEDKTTMSCQVRESIQTWIDMNPGYQHTLYDGNDRLQFVREHYPEFLELYQGLPSNVERADAWRYLALHKLGGVYADSDVKCMQPISTWNAEHAHDAALLVGIAKRNMKTGDTREFNQFVMAAVPGHPVMASMPLIITSNFAASFLNGRRVSQQGIAHDTGVLSRTGPGAFTDALRRYASRVQAPWPVNSTLADQTGGVLFGTVRALPKFVLGMGWDTIDHNMTCLQVKQQIRPEAYICHQFFGTWKKNPEVAIQLSYNNCSASLRYNQFSSGSSATTAASGSTTSSSATTGSGGTAAADGSAPVSSSSGGSSDAGGTAITV